MSCKSYCLLWYNFHLGADGAEVKEGEHILWGEADAAMGDGGTEPGGIIGGVDVDAAGAGIGVVGF